MPPPAPHAPEHYTSALRRRTIRFLILLIVVVAVGTAGYMLIEGWGLVDSLYMAAITLSTVGFGEVRPLSESGRLFTIGLILAGVGTVTVLISTVFEYVLGGHLTGTLRRRRMAHEIDHLKNHYIICGFGRVGQQVTTALAVRQEDFVVVEAQAEALDGIDDDYCYLVGDATDDRVLQAAGIERARGVVVATGDDGTNIVITLTARTLNPNAVIIARANHGSSDPKLKRAGAHHVLSPYRIGGQRMATQLLNPWIIDFFDVVMHSGNLELWLEEVHVVTGSPLAGHTLGEMQVRKRTGVNILAIGRTGDKLRTNPPPDYRFQIGDVLVALGTREQLRELGTMADDDASLRRLEHEARPG